MTILPLTRSEHLLPFAAVGRLLRRAGLPDGCLDAPDTLIPVVAEARFRALAAHKCGLPNIAFTAI